MKSSLIILFFLLLFSCHKEKISVGKNVSDTFYLENMGASMRVTVQGNTLSHVFLILVHGGPGQSSYFYESDYLCQNLENNMAVVYWDQRNAGASQGNANGNNLTLQQMTDDLKKLVQLIKGRYGENSSMFILGHSFGGLLTSSFMTTGSNQSMVRGWIVIDGSHNYRMNDSLTREKLLLNAKEQIILNKNLSFWNGIVGYCNAHTGNFTFEESLELESYAEDAEAQIAETENFDIMDWIKSNAIAEQVPITSVLVNYLYSSQSDLNKQLHDAEFSSSLYKVTIPTLLLYGQYDFICPSELGDDILNRISSKEKELIISPISGHNLMYQDPILFCKKVNEFIKLYK